jgi:hypothetical protein
LCGVRSNYRRNVLFDGVTVTLKKSGMAIDHKYRIYFGFIIVLISKFIKLTAVRNVNVLNVKFKAQICYTELDHYTD